jgi:hypothetical protein
LTKKKVITIWVAGHSHFGQEGDSWPVWGGSKAKEKNKKLGQGSKGQKKKKNKIK